MNNSSNFDPSRDIRILLICLTLLFLPLLKLACQPIPVGSLKEQQFRTLQLLSDSTIKTSFLNRSIWFSTYQNTFNPSNTNTHTWWGQPLSHWETSVTIHEYDDYKLHIGIYSPVLTNTYNSRLPFGRNNGAAWYGRGLNTEFKFGFYITSKYATITFRPDFIYTQNKYFKPPRYTPHYSNGDIRWADPGKLPQYRLANLIDLPFRFGPNDYTTFNLGLSSFRIHYKQIEAGFSTENLWWGPGVQYALAMSNNAAGLPHVFIGTRSPISLPLNIGNIEFRWIFGWPQDSRYFDLSDLNRYIRNVRHRIDPDIGEFKSYYLDHRRILNGINFIYTPSFLPNFSIGISRIIQQYGGGDIFDVFKSFPKASGKDILKGWPTPDYYIKKYPVSSVYFRWVFPKGDAEIYGEYYKEQRSLSFRDFLMEPQNGRAYTLGMQKLIEFNGPINFLKINAEINSTEEGWIDELRPQKYIYTSAAVRQGYTNRGQLMGAAIGPGGKSQFLGVTGYYESGTLGIFIQRQVLKQHFYYEAYDRYVPNKPGKNGVDTIHHRENLNVGLNATYKIGPVFLKGSFIWNRNYNYNLPLFTYPFNNESSIPIADNFQFRLSLNFFF